MTLEMLGFIELEANILIKAAREYKKHILRKNYKYVREGALYLAGKTKESGLFTYLCSFFKKPEIWTYKEAFQYVNRKEDEWYCGSSLIRKRYTKSQEDADAIINACKAAKDGKIILNISENGNIISFYRKIQNARENTR